MQRLLRELLLWSVVLSLLTLVVGFAWMTRQPERAVFHRLTEIPVVGLLISDLRRPYLERDSVSRVGPTTTYGGAQDAAEDAAEDAEPGPPPRQDLQWLGVGSRLHRERSRDSPSFLTTSLATYEVLERDGVWLKVELPDGGSAWVDRSAARDPTPPLGNEPTPPGPLPSRPPNPERLEVALANLGDPEQAAGTDPSASSPRRLRIGGYESWTDIDPAANRELLALLEAGVGSLERRYRTLYGVSPTKGGLASDGRPKEVLVLYAEPADYRALQNATEGLEGTLSVGHTSGGMVAVAVGTRAPWELQATLIHEVTHLLNGRALGPLLPPWLSEGLATHMAQFSSEGEAEGSSAELSDRFRTVGEGSVQYSGPLAALRILAERASTEGLLSLKSLTSTEAAQFLQSVQAPSLYAQSALWIDHLLSQDDLRAPFQAFLKGVAAGRPATGEELRRLLAQPWSELDERFQTWLIARDQAARAAGF